MHEKVAFIHCYQLLKIMGLKDLKHITLIDDPYEEGTPEDRRKAQKWIDKTLKARKGSDTPTINILPMRLHEDDETGELTLDTTQ